MPSAVIRFALISALLSTTAWAQGNEDSVRETAIVKTIRHAQTSVAAVYVWSDRGNSSGSGAVIDPRGYVLTAKHVVGDQHVVLLHGRPPMQAKLIGTMPEYDLAILKLGQQAFNRPASPKYPLDGTPLSFLPLGVADDVMLGETILNMGNPGGRGIIVTRGIICSTGLFGGSALSMATQSSNGFNQFLQFDAASNPGNSGGPLINAIGQQVGVVTSSIRNEEGTHFAVPLNSIRKSISQILNAELRNRFVSGIKIDPFAETVQVSHVDPGSPAANAGLQPGDRIQALGGRDLRGPLDWEFSRLQWQPEQSLELAIVRNKKPEKVSLTLSKRTPQKSIANLKTSPGLFCRAAPYDPAIGEPLADDNRPSKSPMVVEQVTATPSGLAAKDHYELVFDGYLKIDVAGIHRIAIKSDDGSKLFVHDSLVVDNDGNHANQIRTGWVDLAVGLHPIRIEYYEDEGEQNLELLIAFGDDEPKPVSAKQLSHATK